MATVGELLAEQWTYMSSLEVAIGGPATALEVVRNMLKALGIWDAEIHEGWAAARHRGLPEQIPLRAHAGRWEQAITFHPKKPWRAMGVKQGDRVRVIVLPPREEEGE